MVEVALSVVNPSGLHARPAAEFVRAAGQFTGTRITVACGSREVDAKSILGVLSLGVRQGQSLILRAEGPRAEEAADVLCRLVAGGFGEI